MFYYPALPKHEQIVIKKPMPKWWDDDPKKIWKEQKALDKKKWYPGPVQQQILRILKDNPARWFTVQELINLFGGGHRGNFRKALKILADKNRVDRSKNERDILIFRHLNGDQS